MNNTTSHQGRLKSLRAAGIGNALEWFDWTLYATFSVYLASNLFDKTDAEHGRSEDAYSFMLGDGDARFRASILAPDLGDASIAMHSRGAGVVVHFHKGRGEVFTAATCEWVHGLMQADIYTVMITKNVLERFLRNT